MDKKGRIQEHSKIKLELFRLYLELYLAVLLNAKTFSSLNIHDPFAGRGKTGNENGSALLAAIEIQKARAKYPSTPIALQLNEKDSENFKSLQNVLKLFLAFTSLSNLDANDYISSWAPPSGSHNLFFIDPHGYTQISSKNLRRLFTYGSCDFLIFVPVYHIYRFLKPGQSGVIDEDDDYNFFDDLGIASSEKKPPVDKEKYYEPIAKFLSGLGIEKSNAESAGTVEEFAAMIVEALKRISGSDFVYPQMIKKKGKNSKYCLFFISKHILGAEKFLDASRQLLLKINGAAEQQAFDFVSDMPRKLSILDFIKFGQMYDNVQLYELAIKSGIRPTELIAELRDLESKNPASISVSAVPGKERRKKGFYTNYKHFKSHERIVTIEFHQDHKLL